VYCFLNGFLQKICVVILFCSLAVLDGWTQQTTAFKPLGTLSWLKRNVISHTEKLNTKITLGNIAFPSQLTYDCKAEPCKSKVKKTFVNEARVW
jgi:hypothetical protein